MEVSDVDPESPAYARYSSENQRPESIDDQVSSCKKLAAQRGFTVDESLVFSDEATSGARTDRKGLASLLAAGSARRFDIVLVDDLSRLARDNYLMLSMGFHCRGGNVRVSIHPAQGFPTEGETPFDVDLLATLRDLSIEREPEAVLRALR